MSEVQRKENHFVAYEYKKITVRNDMENVWRDGLSHFGWKLEKRKPAIVKHAWGPIGLMLAPLALIPGSPTAKIIRDHPSETRVDLIFKRNKDLPQKSKLSQLQSSFEACTVELNHLEQSKHSTATVVSYVVGLIGTVFMAGSVFDYLAGRIPLSVVMAVPGFAGWILPYFLYQVLTSRKVKKLTPLIDKRYDHIYELCAKANALLQSEKAK